MAIVLQTNTVLNIVDDDFTLTTSYSGGVNPNVTYTYTLTVTDTNTNVIIGAIVTINSIEYTTDSNGQISVDLERGDYIATVVKTGYVGGSDTFTILDVNVSNSVELSIIGSFDTSFDNSFDSLQEYIVYDDWFLPSRDELKAMYDNLYIEGVGRFNSIRYWASSEDSATRSTFLSFDNGSFGTFPKSETLSSWKARACRSFTSEVGAYSLRDIGPAGGLIFYIDGTTYYEAYLEDVSSPLWSNVEELVGTSTAIGTGQANTTAIINQAGHTDSAALLCDELVINN